MKRSLAVLVVLLLVSKGIAVADSVGTVSLYLPSSPIGDPVSVQPAGASGYEDTNLGPYRYELSNPSNSTVASLLGMDSHGKVTKDGFCVALTTNIFENTKYDGFSVNPLSDVLGTAATTNVLKLLYDYSKPIALGGGGGDPTNPFGSPEIANDALGAAIWEVLNGTSLQLNATSQDVWLKARSSTSPATIASSIDLANTWLSGLSSQTVEQTASDVYALVKPGVQTQSIVIEVGHTDIQLPEPRSLVGLIGMGLVGLLVGGIMAFRSRASIARSS